MNLSIRVKIIIAVIVVIFIMGSLATYTVYISAQKNLLNLENKSLIELNESLTQEIGLFLEQKKEFVNNISQDPEIKNYMTRVDREFQDRQIFNKLKSFEINENYASIYLMDASGLTWASTDESFVGKNYGFRNYFHDAMNLGEGFAVVRGVTSGEVGYYFASRIEGDNSYLGVVVIKLRAQEIEKIFEGKKTEDWQKIMLAESSGVIIYSSDENDFLKSLGRLNTLRLKRLEENRSFEDVDILPLHYDEIQARLSMINRVDVFDINRLARQYRVAISPIKDFGLYLLLDRDETSITGISGRLSSQLALYVFGAAIIAIIVIALLIKRLLLPLEDLNKFVRKMSQGEYGGQLEVGGSKEIKELSQSYNKLSTQLKKEKDSVDKKIAEKTGRLEKLNQYMVGREDKMIELKKTLKETQDKIKELKKSNED